MARKRRTTRLASETYTAEITDLSHDGRGIAHLDGKATFIHGALPGETVRFHYTKQQRHQDSGTTDDVLIASPDRVNPGCAHYAICGGCSLQHLAPAAQIAAKQQQLMDNLRRIGKVSPQTWLAPLVDDSTWGYRRKARLGVKYVQKKGRVLVGFRERGSGFIADLDHCPVLHPQVGTQLAGLAQMIQGLSIKEQIPQIEVVMDDTQCVLIFRILTPLSPADRELLSAYGAPVSYTHLTLPTICSV